MLYADFSTDYGKVLAQIDAFTTGIGIVDVIVDEHELENALYGMKEPFPAKGGLSEASAFKKAANFFCYFIAHQPISRPFDKEYIGETLFQINNHQNVMVAYDLAIRSLHNATIERRDGTTIKLENKIKISKHSYVDLIHACKSVTPHLHFHIIAVLFEQLVYRSNPQASYNCSV